MEKSEETYHIDKKAREIYSKKVISRKFVKSLGEEELQEIIAEDNYEIIIETEENKLFKIENREEFYHKKIKGHINSELEYKEMETFENSYFYFAELWKMKFGKKLILLRYYH